MSVRRLDIVLDDGWAAGEWPTCIEVAHSDSRGREVYSAKVVRYVPIDGPMCESLDSIIENAEQAWKELLLHDDERKV